MEDAILDLLRTARNIAVVGLSPQPSRPSYVVATYLRAHGYRVIPVNPNFSEILGEQCYSDLTSIPVPVDVVDIFRRAKYVPEIVDQAIKIGARAVWMQVGIVNEEAADKARRAGLIVVMDRCMHVEHERYRLAGLL
ncbi:MAG: CoA-binding protein [Chloroflexota bacterium]